MLELALSGDNVVDLSLLQGMPIERLEVWKAKVADLSPLRGMPLKHLHLSHTSVADLKPLRGMPLKEIRLFHTQVADLSPLQGMPLERLDLGYTNVADISVLRGMPLIEAKFSNCTAITDLSPLAESQGTPDHHPSAECEKLRVPPRLPQTRTPQLCGGFE